MYARRLVNSLMLPAIHYRTPATNLFQQSRYSGESFKELSHGYLGTVQSILTLRNLYQQYSLRARPSTLLAWEKLARYSTGQEAIKSSKYFQWVRQLSDHLLTSFQPRASKDLKSPHIDQTKVRIMFEGMSLFPCRLGPSYFVPL
jgi:hypothetical protein